MTSLKQKRKSHIYIFFWNNYQKNKDEKKINVILVCTYLLCWLLTGSTLPSGARDRTKVLLSHSTSM